MTPDSRRALRSVIHAIGALIMLVFLGWIIWRGEHSAIVSLGLVAILFVREMFHGAENVTARIKFGASKDGVTGEVEPGKEDDVQIT